MSAAVPFAVATIDRRSPHRPSALWTRGRARRLDRARRPRRQPWSARCPAWWSAAASALIEHGRDAVFVEVLRPPPHLVIFGAGDDALPLVAAGRRGRVRRSAVVDHRPAYLAADRFPPEVRRVLRRVRRTALGGLALGPAPLRRGADPLARPRPRVDPGAARLAHRLPGLARAAHAPGGAADASWGRDPDDRLFAPVGLDLGADGPEQVAVSIVAELLAVHSRPHAGSSP